MEIRTIHPSELEYARRLLIAGGWTTRVDGVATFYEKIGFAQSEVAMEWPGVWSDDPLPTQAQQ